MIARRASLSPWRAAAYGLPLATILAAILMMPLSLGIKLAGYWLMPSLPMLAIFLWALYRPDLLPPLGVLAAGLFMDLVIGAPAGVSSLAFLVAYAITVSQRLYWVTLPPTNVLVGFIFVIFAAEMACWLATSFAHGRFLSPAPALIEGVMSIVVFPLARGVFAPLQRLAGPAV